MVFESCEAVKPSENSLEISNRLQQYAREKHIPLNVTIELTHKCNFKCLHCYNLDRSVVAAKDVPQTSVDFDRWVALFLEIRQAGGFAVCFTGGEALTHPWLPALIKKAREQHLLTRLKSNGALLDSKRIEKLAAVGLNQIEISLYGASESTYFSFTQTTGNYAKVLEGLHLAKAVGLDLSLNIILHQGNVHELTQMKALAKDLGIPCSVGIELTARHDGSRNSIDQRLSLEQMRTLFESKNGVDFVGPVNSGLSVQCSCALTHCGIAMNGDVYPCLGAPILAGNIRNQDFGQVWKKSETFNRIRRLKLEDFEDCKTCQVRQYCFRSSGSVYVNTGNYTGRDEWACQVASLNAELSAL